MYNSAKGQFESSTVNIWSLIEFFKSGFGKWVVTPLANVNSANG
jgi:hypothetical protein